MQLFSLSDGGNDYDDDDDDGGDDDEEKDIWFQYLCILGHK